MKNVFALITLFISSGASIIGCIAAPTRSTSSLEGRSADTCADPSLAVTYIQAFSPTSVGYAMATVADFTNGITADKGGWDYQGNVFLAWHDPQNFTTPLYEFFDQTTQDWLVAISTDGNPPSFTGFTQSQNTFGYVYSSPICGSVPLFGASNQAAGSHFYTTNANDHGELIALSGWADAGITAYVLPLS